jgi:hypothetical protein
MMIFPYDIVEAEGFLNVTSVEMAVEAQIFLPSPRRSLEYFPAAILFTSPFTIQSNPAKLHRIFEALLLESNYGRMKFLPQRLRDGQIFRSSLSLISFPPSFEFLFTLA